MANLAGPSPPTEEQWDALVQSVKESLVEEEVGSEAWYLIIATVLTVSPRPHLVADFWTYLTTSATSSSSFTSPESQKRLSTRLGDLLLKQLTLIGAPQMLAALIPLAKRQVESGMVQEEGKPEMDVQEWSKSPFPMLHTRGIETITSIYSSLWQNIFSTFGPHRRAVGLHELTIVYGLYLSDFTYLSALETEIVVYTCITCQGLRGPALWHVRGLGRVLGARGSDDSEERVRKVKDVLRGVKVAVASAVEFCGDDMVRRSGLDGAGEGMGWPNVGDVVRELGGWGED